jgi:hypothetical protein
LFLTMKNDKITWQNNLTKWNGPWIMCSPVWCEWRRQIVTTLQYIVMLCWMRAKDENKFFCVFKTDWDVVEEWFVWWFRDSGMVQNGSRLFSNAGKVAGCV